MWLNADVDDTLAFVEWTVGNGQAAAVCIHRGVRQALQGQLMMYNFMFVVLQMQTRWWMSMPGVRPSLLSYRSSLLFCHIWLVVTVSQQLSLLLHCVVWMDFGVKFRLQHFYLCIISVLCVHLSRVCEYCTVCTCVTYGHDIISLSQDNPWHACCRQEWYDPCHYAVCVMHGNPTTYGPYGPHVCIPRTWEYDCCSLQQDNVMSCHLRTCHQEFAAIFSLCRPDSWQNHTAMRTTAAWQCSRNANLCTWHNWFFLLQHLQPIRYFTCFCQAHEAFPALHTQLSLAINEDRQAS